MAGRRDDGYEGVEAFDDLFGPPRTGDTGELEVVPGAETDELPVVSDEPILAESTTDQPAGTEPQAPAEPDVDEDTNPRKELLARLAQDDPEPVAAAPAAAWPAAPARRAPRESRDGRGITPFAAVATIIAALLVGALAMLLFTMSRDDDTPIATPPPTTQAAPAPSSETPSSAPPTTSSSSSTSEPAERKGELPSGATACGGPVEGVRAGTASDVTSCEFARAVRDAYVKADPEGEDVSVRATSPVTRKAYSMRCTGDVVTRCTGGDNAVVVLY